MGCMGITRRRMSPKVCPKSVCRRSLMKSWWDREREKSLRYLKGFQITLKIKHDNEPGSHRCLFTQCFIGSCCDLLWGSHAVLDIPFYLELIHNHKQPRAALVLIHGAGWLWSLPGSTASLSKPSQLCFCCAFAGVHLNFHTYFMADFHWQFWQLFLLEGD